MALQTFVKVSKVNNLSDARYCAGMGVDVIGFNLVPGTPHHMNPERFKEITEWLSGVAFAGEFEGLGTEEIQQISSSYSLQYIQITDANLIPSLAELGIPLILKIKLDENPAIASIEQLLKENRGKVSYFLLESEQDAYQQDLLDKILALAETYPILLGYGLHPGNAQDIIERSSIRGIALMGEEEIRAGYKDFEKLADMLEVLEMDEFDN
ncbi:phosphoribosylanthranilate isomerase [Nafulsella turpanensis]|uniref:phosphoribosylanthranilate isomerase n=1 Tax=Nafulsella turpanensis TaxID=1265690 RepID=UPI00034859BA|nr:hypothetical protein [Nafulsella turpanensis]